MAIKRENITASIYNQPTLGGRSEFEYTIEKGKLLLRFGSMVNFLEAKEDWVNDVKERIQKLKKNIQNIKHKLLYTIKINGINVQTIDHALMWRV
ncbi:MAG: hypothetical protein RL259_244 [Bacteroidota bacterium]|jgi:hypothetical protein